MRKTIIGTVIAASTMAMIATADAGPRRHHRGGHNWVPYAIGGMALGILGAGIASQQHYYRECWRERRPMYDRWGNYLGRRWIRVCR